MEIIEKREVMCMDDLNNLKVVEHNDLITGIAKMDTIPIKIFELAVSCIDAKNPPEDNIVYLSKSTVFDFFNVSSNSKHSRFRQSINKLQEQSVFLIKQVEEQGYSFKSISPITMVEWNDFNDIIAIEFSRHIMPYLIDLKTNFTQYLLSDISKLKSKYSIFLYKWLTMNFNQYEKYENLKQRNQIELEKLKNPKISVEQLRETTDTKTKYKHFPHFEQRILKDSIEEINENTHFKISYKKIKKGRSIATIQFFIEKKFVAPITPIGEEAPIVKKSKEEIRQEENAIIGEAMNSEYTELLTKRFLIGIHTFQSRKDMIALQTVLYPIYDEIKKLIGLNGVEEHIDYVSNKSSQKTDSVAYLITSAKRYLPRVKIKNLEIESKEDVDKF